MVFSCSLAISQSPSLPSYASLAYPPYDNYTHDPVDNSQHRPYLNTQTVDQPHEISHMRPPVFIPHIQYSGYHQQIPVIMTDDLVSGTRHPGRMSSVRRFERSLCTFDIFFTSLLWVIPILVTGRYFVREIHQQVVKHTLHSSMFDCVMAAGARFLVHVSF